MLEEMRAQRQLDTGDMSRSRVASAASKPFESVPFVGLRNTLPSDIDSISSFVEQLMNFISKFRAVGQPNFEIELALREALVNAIVHGNRKQPQSVFTSIAVVLQEAKCPSRSRMKVADLSIKRSWIQLLRTITCGLTAAGST